MAPKNLPKRSLDVIEEDDDYNNRTYFENAGEIQAFQGNTLVYRSVANRARKFPLFLYRNLTYFKGRMTRPKKRPDDFDFDTFFKERPRIQPKEQKYLTITYLGFYTDSSILSNFDTVRMETIISKQRGGRKGKQHVRVSAGVCEVYVNPGHEDNRPVPIISIPPDMLNLDSSTQMLAKSLVIRLVADNNSEEEFECEHILLNENGTCPLVSGQYELKAIKSAPIWIKPWALGTDLSNMSVDRPMLSYHLEWTSEAKSGWVSRNDSNKMKQIAGQDLKNGANKENLPAKGTKSASLSNANYTEPSQIKLEFQFLVEERIISTFLTSYDYMCPWCDLNCVRFYGLFKHLKVNHERFLFNFTKSGDKKISVDVKINDKADISNGGDPTREFFKKEGPRRMNPYTEVSVWKPPRKRSVPNIEKLLDRQAFPDVESQRIVSGHNRMYFHSSTALPIHPTEMDEDSENERDPLWLRQKTAMMIDDFTDVNEGEKEVIKLWNLHTLHKGYVGDCQRLKANKDFFAKIAPTIVERNLYRNGVLHLANQFHFSLLGSAHAHRIYRPVHQELMKNKAAMKRFRDLYLKERTGWIECGGEGGIRDKAKREFQLSSGPSTLSTFVTGDGTLRRKMTIKSGCKSKIVNMKGKDRNTRKRKLSLEDRTIDKPAKRSRGGSDPNEQVKPKIKTTNREKQVMRKTAT